MGFLEFKVLNHKNCVSWNSSFKPNAQVNFALHVEITPCENPQYTVYHTEDYNVVPYYNSFKHE